VAAQPRGHHGAFGEDRFGQFAEKAARFFGTPQYIIGQTLVVAAWMVLNALPFIYHWDPKPFILLNLIFSTQAAYAAPLILLAQTRQADRDKIQAEAADRKHTQIEEAASERTRAIKTETDRLTELLASNTELTQQDKDLTEQVHALTKEIHELLTQRA
jgi:uncharacterized membrane protein